MTKVQGAAERPRFFGFQRLELCFRPLNAGGDAAARRFYQCYLDKAAFS